MSKAYVGISGWTYPPWRGTFYPKKLVQKKELEFASRQLNSIEINGTFYSLQKPESFQKWHDEVPDDFVFAVKAPQYITHIRRLKEIEEPLANFFASGLLCLKKKMGPILWQFPPNVMLKDNRFERFLELLPHDSTSAEALAKQHGEKVEGRSYTKAEKNLKIRHAFEFRHPSFANADFLALLKSHNVAFVIAHAGSEKAPYLEELTADFAYLRMHGEGKEYKKGYPPKEIKSWSQRIASWTKENKDVFIYFTTEAKVYSPQSAMALLKQLD